MTSMSPSPRAGRVSPLGLYLGIFLGIFFFTHLLGGQTQPYNDGRQMFGHAESLVYNGTFGIPDASGKAYYNPRPMLVSLVHVPGVLLRKGLAAVFPAADAVTRIMTSHIVPAALLALTGVLFVRYLLLIGVGVAAASLSALALVLSSILFVFGRVVWSEAVQTIAFVGLFTELLLAARAPDRRAAIKIGTFAGLLVCSKYLYVLSLPGAALFLVTQLWGRVPRRRLLVLLAWAAVAFLPFAAFIGWSNHVRYGSALSAGYDKEPFQEALFWGVYSLLFSFGKGLFIYDPVLVLAFHRREKLPRGFWTATLLVCGPIVGLYGTYSNWGGDWSWGPRYAICLVPVLMIAVAVRLDDWLARRQTLLLGLFLVLAGVGFFVQLLGAGMYWDHHIRLSKATATQWLGSPNRGGGYTRDYGGHCDPCFEDLHHHTYTPAFQPIEGHFWLIKHSSSWSGRPTWEECDKDAPWHRYTSLSLDAAKAWCPGPAIDWWYLMFRGPFALAGKILFALFLAGSVAGFGLWVRAAVRLARAAGPLPPGAADR
jgi:hypothetical protein